MKQQVCAAQIQAARTDFGVGRTEFQWSGRLIPPRVVNLNTTDTDTDTAMEHEMHTPVQIDGAWLAEKIDSAVREDVGQGDFTAEATVDLSQTATASIVAKQDGVVCGGWLAREVFKRVDGAIQADLLQPDGARVSAGDALVALSGRARSILTAERVALNFFQRMSGIATTTRRVCDLVSGYDVKVLDTRKTVPGLRVLDKYSVTQGGGFNHRLGLYDMVLIKENHVALAGGVGKAIDMVRGRMRHTGRTMPIEVEVETWEEFLEAVSYGVDYIMLDNFTENSVEAAVTHVRRTGAHVQLEASGNITVDNVVGYARTGVHRISMGWLTHSVVAFDMSLRIG